MSNQEKAKDILKSSGAMWEGHFLLTSGRHADTYIQCAKVCQYPEHNEQLCKELASRFDGEVDVVFAAAIGGIILAYELARQLGARAVFCERVDGEMEIRRGMEISPEERVLIVEDVITTGGTVNELVEKAEGYGAKITGIAALVNRNVERNKFDHPTLALVEGVMEDYKPEDCPLCKKGEPLVKPGSRDFTKK